MNCHELCIMTSMALTLSLKQAKIVYNFGISECNRVTFDHISLHLNVFDYKAADKVKFEDNSEIIFLNP